MAPILREMRRVASNSEEQVGRPTFVTVVVSGRVLLREGLSHILDGAGFEISAAATTLGDAMASLSAEDRQILLLLEIRSGQGEIAEQIKLFKQQHPTARIALLVEHDLLSNSELVDAFRVGADAYLVRPDADGLVKSLELLIQGQTILPVEVLPVFLDCRDRNSYRRDGVVAAAQSDVPAVGQFADDATPSLTAREECVLQDLIKGYPNKTISRRHDITEQTVKVHVKAILRKLRLKNRTQAAIWGMNRSSYDGASGKIEDVGRGGSSGIAAQIAA